MVNNLGQTDEGLVAVTLTHNTNVTLLGRAFKLPVIFEKNMFCLQKRYVVVRIMDLIMDNKVESTVESLRSLAS